VSRVFWTSAADIGGGGGGVVIVEGLFMRSHRGILLGGGRGGGCRRLTQIDPLRVFLVFGL